MAKYFDISPTGGKGSGAITVTPKAGFTGAGTVNETIAVTVTSDATKKATVICSRAGSVLGLDYSGMKVYTAPTLDGVYTPATPTINNGLIINTPAATTWVKVEIPFNAENISLEDLINTSKEHDSYAKMWGKWLKADGTLSDSRVSLASVADGTPINLAGNPGALSATTLEVYFCVGANVTGDPITAHEYNIGIPADDENAVIRIHQAKGTSTLSVSPTSLDFGGSVTPKTVTVSSNSAWTAAIS